MQLDTWPVSKALRIHIGIRNVNSVNKSIWGHVYHYDGDENDAYDDENYHVGTHERYVRNTWSGNVALWGYAGWYPNMNRTGAKKGGTSIISYYPLKLDETEGQPSQLAATCSWNVRGNSFTEGQVVKRDVVRLGGSDNSSTWSASDQGIWSIPLSRRGRLSLGRHSTSCDCYIILGPRNDGRRAPYSSWTLF